MRRLQAVSTPAPPRPSLADICADFEPYRLVQARQLAMLSRADISDSLGVAAWEVLHWEANISTPRPDQLQKLADLTGHIPAFFKGGRPMMRLTEADCHFRPCAYGR